MCTISHFFCDIQLCQRGQFKRFLEHLLAIRFKEKNNYNFPKLMAPYSSKIDIFKLKNIVYSIYYRLSDATFYDCINTKYQYIKPSWTTKMYIFEKYEAFKVL